mgnify:CR=1 FL=1
MPGSREVIQRLVQTIPQEDLEKIQRQQNYLNRYINKYFSAAESKTKKEALQRRVSSSCRRAVGPVPEYKVYGAVAQRDVSVQAMAKGDQVEMAAEREDGAAGHSAAVGDKGGVQTRWNFNQRILI